MRFTEALESLGQYKQINKRVLLCVPLRSLRSLSDLVQPLHFLQQQSTHSSGRQAAKTVSMSRLFSILISIFRFIPCCLCEWVQYYTSCFMQTLKMSTPQSTACLYKGICKPICLWLTLSFQLLKNISDLQQIGMKFMTLHNTKTPYFIVSCIE